MKAMAKHLSEERLLDVVEGAADEGARSHVTACPACRRRVDEAALGLALAYEADVPEPSPLYWEAFRSQVGRRILSEDRTSWRWRLVPLLAAAAALVVIVPSLKAPGGAPGSLAPVVPAWSALPPAEEDPGLVVLQGLAASDSELAPPREGRGVAELLGDLSEEESLALTDALRKKLKEGEL
jgi:hypothetical protein